MVITHGEIRNVIIRVSIKWICNKKDMRIWNGLYIILYVLYNYINLHIYKFIYII